MFGLGMQELLIILAILMLLFGARRLPELGSGLGRAIRSFKDGLSSDGAKELGPGEKREDKP